MDKKTYKEYIKTEVYKNSNSVFIKVYNRFLNPATNAVFIFRKSQYLHNQQGIIAKIRVALLTRKLAIKYGILTYPDVTIGKGLRFVHPTSIVIGKHVVAGENLSLYQNTTIGGARTGDVNKGNQPYLGDNVTLFSNSLILGKIKIGNNVVIGANSLLLDSVPDDCVVAGSPAKIIKSRGE